MDRILIDSHVHTILSGHAYSTIIECARYAKEKGMQGLVCAEHGPGMPLSLNEWGINIMIKTFPDIMEGVRVFRGIEANILNHNGDLDVDEDTGMKLEFVIASMHDVIIPPKSVMENTEAALAVINKKYVDVIGHPDRNWSPMDVTALVRETKKLGKIIEMNNHSFSFIDAGSVKTLKTLINECKKQDVRITLASDAHIACNVGEFPKALKMLEEENFPYELIVNRNLDSFEKYLADRPYRK